MIDRVISALILFTFEWFRVRIVRDEFKDTLEEYKALIYSLETANATDEDKNEILERSVIRLLLKRRELRKS